MECEGRWVAEETEGSPYLLHDPVDLAVLRVNLIAHIQGHVTEVSNHATDLFQVFIHLAFPSIVCYPVREQRPQSADLCGRGQGSHFFLWAVWDRALGHNKMAAVGGGNLPQNGCHTDGSSHKTRGGSTVAGQAGSLRSRVMLRLTQWETTAQQNLASIMWRSFGGLSYLTAGLNTPPSPTSAVLILLLNS